MPKQQIILTTSKTTFRRFYLCDLQFSDGRVAALLHRFQASLQLSSLPLWDWCVINHLKHITQYRRMKFIHHELTFQWRRESMELCTFIRSPISLESFWAACIDGTLATSTRATKDSNSSCMAWPASRAWVTGTVSITETELLPNGRFRYSNLFGFISSNSNDTANAFHHLSLRHNDEVSNCSRPQ